MYKAGFVANIVHQGKIMDDKNGTVALPFGAEYKLRLKNKNDRDAVAKVTIDGRDVTERGDLILHANATDELERFIDSLYDGCKFKFVSLDDVSSSEKDNPKNGVVEIRFRLTKRPTERVIYHHPLVEEHHYYYPRRRDYYECPPYPNYPYTTWCAAGTSKSSLKGMTAGDVTINTSGGVGSATSDSSIFNCSTNTSGLSNLAFSCSSDVSDVDDGKTVEGSHSGQRFEYGYIGELETQETVIRLKIVGYDSEKCGQTEPKQYCSGCGLKIWDHSKFCSQCGQKLN